MKKQFNKNIVILFVFLIYNNTFTFSQETVCYPLSNSFESGAVVQPPLTVLSNSSGGTGNFTTLAATNNLCNSGGDMDLYFFEKNAGLKFDNSNGFIDSFYTIEMVFNFDEISIPFLSFNGWAKVLGFAEDDSGFYINKITPFLGNTSFQFEVWNNFSSLAPCLFPTFNEGDFLKLTIVRNESGIVDFYVDCNLVCNYDDSDSNLFFPELSTGNQILFFKDYITAGIGEASSGNVKNIKFSNFAKSATEIMAECDCFCEELTSCEMVFNALSFSCDPSDVVFLADTLFSHCSCACDSIFIQETQLVESPYLLDSIIIADSGNGDGSISINAAGGVAPYSYLWNNGATTFSISNLETGIYSVTVVDVNGCELNLDFEVDMLNALEEIPSLNFQIYPNPISKNERLVIKWEGIKTTYLQFELFDVSGQLIFKNELQFDLGTTSHFLDNKMEGGIYFLKIKDKKGRSAVRKIVVIK